MKKSITFLTVICLSLLSTLTVFATSIVPEEGSSANLLVEVLKGYEDEEGDISWEADIRIDLDLIGMRMKIHDESGNPKEGITYQAETSDGLLVGQDGDELLFLAESMKSVSIGISEALELEHSVVYRVLFSTGNWSDWEYDNNAITVPDEADYILDVEINLFPKELDDSEDIVEDVDGTEGEHVFPATMIPPMEPSFGAIEPIDPLAMSMLEAQTVSIVPQQVAAQTIEPSVSYQVHVQNIGWQGAVSNGALAGTTGRALRLEAIRVNLNSPSISGGINYSTHVQNIGWQSQVSNGAVSGTTGNSLRIEGIRISLSGDIATRYSVYYRLHVANFGWLGWAKDGELSGSAGLSYRAEAIEIRLVAKPQPAPGSSARAFIHVPTLSYQAHVQNIGWQTPVSNGQTAGTTGRGLRLEALRINLGSTNIGGGLSYKAHVQNIGWQALATSGGLAGSAGQSLRIEAMTIALTGELAAHYDIYYRLHIAEYGWLSWAKNGQQAGSAGIGYRAEAIEIRLVLKGSDAPGKTDRPFVTQPIVPTVIVPWQLSWGQTYVAIDYNQQRLFYVLNGQLRVDSPVVTGKPPTMSTPKGTFTLLGKQRNAILRGIGYATPVSYWMPFTVNGHGIHDATWQSRFGGTQYLISGSHGCVNMPLDKAAQLFNLIQVGTRIIIF